MFDEEEEDAFFVPEEEIMLEMKLAKDDPKVAVTRQKLIQGYRKFKEETTVARYLNMV